MPKSKKPASRSKAASMIAAIANPASWVCIDCTMRNDCKVADCRCPKCVAKNASKK